jgi:hypothetical protein
MTFGLGGMNLIQLVWGFNVSDGECMPSSTIGSPPEAREGAARKKGDRVNTNTISSPNVRFGG